MSLQGQLVEICGLQDVLHPTPRMLEINPNVESLQVNGLQGWAVEWVPEELRYQVETFSGDCVCIPEENLRVYHPSSATDGGFDAAWPALGLEAAFETFAETIARSLIERSFSLVQMTTSSHQARSTLTRASMFDDWSRIIPEFERSFLGTGTSGKIHWLPPDSDAAAEDSLGQADKVLTALASILSPFCHHLGFVPGTRSAGLLRMPFEDVDEEASLVRGTNANDHISGREIQGCLQFTKLKRIGLIYFLHGSGGTLKLSYNDPEVPPVEIPIEQGRLLLFRHDLMSYSYAPKGKRALALQAWIFREELQAELELAPAGKSEVLEAWDMDKVPSAPNYGDSGQTVDIMSLACSMPGNISSAEDYWQLLTGGCDGMVGIPINRWDNSLYYDPHDTKGGTKMYCNHNGFCQEYHMFNSELFGVPDEEVAWFPPLSWRCLEKGYECLAKAGWTLDTLRDTDLGISVGFTLGEHAALVHRGEAQPMTSEYLCNNKNSNHQADFLPYHLGVRGPMYLADTACSSSLCACAVAHSLVRPALKGALKSNHSHQQVPSALAMGSHGVFEPFYTISLCGAGMLTHNGRCFTFDASADGYARSEGTGALHMQVHSTEQLSRMAVMIGSAMNQDGRSASLTAPNGPSQTAIAKQSMREASITAFDIQAQELHGTGTPLGDPIEVGALRACMMADKGVTRSLPLVKTSSKSAIGHGEMNAGIAGLMKCVLMLLFSTASPGLHIRILNSNMDAGGYPVIFNSEHMDTGKTSDNCGVSSFGFSGCNVRADVWGMATAGHRAALPIGLDYTEERHNMFGGMKYSYAGRAGLESPMYQSCGAERPETFDGMFANGLLDEGSQLSLSGTWNSWTTPTLMEKLPEVTGDAVMYQAGFRIGETLVEELCIQVNNFVDNFLFPAVPSAGQDAIVLGPGTAPKGYNWRVDGRTDGARVGTVYVVSCLWYPGTHEKQVTWEMMTEELEHPFPLHDFRHRYGVIGTWTSHAYQEMRETSQGCYETVFRIGSTGSEEFHFARDDDRTQLIYPTVSTVVKTSVPVRGPDGNGRGKYWAVMGSTGDLVELKLCVVDGQIEVHVSWQGSATRTWYSLAPTAVGHYFVADYDGRCVPMTPCKDRPGVHRCSMKVVESDGQYFQIQIDKDPSQAFYPELNGAVLSGISSALGPDGMGQESFWQIQAEAGSKVEIVLDLKQADPRRIVTWSDTSSRTLEDRPVGLYRPEDDE